VYLQCMFRDSHCHFSSMRLKSGGYGTPHSKKWGVRVPPVPSESYAYANTHRRRDSTIELSRVGGVYWA